MLDNVPSLFSVVVAFLLTILHGISYLSRNRFSLPPVLRFVWIFFAVIAISEWVSFETALWITAVLSFFALREFFSLFALRLEDRWGMLVSYLSIPFMFYLIRIDWYGFFIIAIPVYTFLIMPFFVALGRKSKGIVFSIGAIDFGLFFYVFCMGHITYLIYFSARMAMLMIVAATVSDTILRYVKSGPYYIRFLLQTILILSLYVLSAGWSGIPLIHSAALGIIIPVLACMGGFTLKAIEDDLGIRNHRLQPGRGRTIDGLKTYLFTAPIVFHYLRWFLKWGDL